MAICPHLWQCCHWQKSILGEQVVAIVRVDWHLIDAFVTSECFGEKKRDGNVAVLSKVELTTR